jgi:hypothetical protein
MERRLATSGLVYEPVPKSETSATVMLTLGTPGLHLSEDCNMVTIPLVLAVESASGALHVELSGRVYRRAQQGEWRAYASADLAGLRGKLDFGIETGRVFIGKLFTEFGLCADILHGHFSVDGFYYADRESADAWARNDLTGISARGRSRTPYGDDAPARRAAFAWPDEGCFVSSE